MRILGCPFSSQVIKLRLTVKWLLSQRTGFVPSPPTLHLSHLTIPHHSASGAARANPATVISSTAIPHISKLFLINITNIFSFLILTLHQSTMVKQMCVCVHIHTHVHTFVWQKSSCYKLLHMVLFGKNMEENLMAFKKDGKQDTDDISSFTVLKSTEMKGKHHLWNTFHV